METKRKLKWVFGFTSWKLQHQYEIGIVSLYRPAEKYVCEIHDTEDLPEFQWCGKEFEMYIYLLIYCIYFRVRQVENEDKTRDIPKGQEW
jgi:hypothetical protein